MCCRKGGFPSTGLALDPSYRQLTSEWFDLDGRCREAYCAAYRTAYTATKLSDRIRLGGEPDKRDHTPDVCGHGYGCTGCVVDHRDSSECDEDCTFENCLLLRSIGEMFGLFEEL
ncbi:hypothetical protein [Nocardia sp. NPDC052566]|uniref:hypothetical protein n=1 Tax=Nocardia sp. NPDC052566 TaxID=3364330 RepID=UPI0037CA394C